MGDGSWARTTRWRCSTPIRRPASAETHRGVSDVLPESLALRALLHARAGRVCGRVGAWARGRVGAWARGFVGVWVRGCVGAWVRQRTQVPASNGGEGWQHRLHGECLTASEHLPRCLWR